MTPNFGDKTIWTDVNDAGAPAWSPMAKIEI